MDIDEVRLDIVALLGQAEISQETLRSLKRGDIIVLDRRVNDPLALYVAGEKRFLGVAGGCKEIKALKVEKNYG